MGGPGQDAPHPGLWSSLTPLFFLVMVLRKKDPVGGLSNAGDRQLEDRTEHRAVSLREPWGGPRPHHPETARGWTEEVWTAVLPHREGRDPCALGPALRPCRAAEARGEEAAGLQGTPSLQMAGDTPSLQHCFHTSLSNEPLQAWPGRHQGSPRQVLQAANWGGLPSASSPRGGQRSLSSPGNPPLAIHLCSTRPFLWLLPTHLPKR